MIRHCKMLSLLALVALPTLAFGQTEEVRYYHQDAVGSVRMVTDANGQIVERYDYLPFGEPWTATPTGTETRRFGGKERDGETAFDYFGARYYASQTGRFISVDPVLNIEDALIDPQRWNRYAYAYSNPLRFIDPDGKQGLEGALQADYDAWVKGRISDAEYQARVQEHAKAGSLTLGIGAAVGALWASGPVAWRAAVGCFLSPSCQSSAIDILEGAAGGPPRVTGAVKSSGEIGQIIGWGTGQAAGEVAQTVRVTRELTAGRVAELAKQGVTREWVERQLALYRKSLESGNRKLENNQLLPRIELMEKLLKLWPEQ